MPAASATSTPSWGRRLAGIEGLRAIACAMVLVGHVQWMGADEPYPLGRFTALAWMLAPTGLILFFVLSGFLLYRPFASAIVLGYAAPEPRRFLRNRAWRIVPAYLVILLVAGLVLGLAVTNADGLFVTSTTEQVTDAQGSIGRLTDPGLLLANLFLVQNYVPPGVLTGLGPAWSLGVEVAFYVTLPVLALAAARVARGRRLRERTLAGLAPAAVLLAVGITGKLVAAALASDGSDPREQWGRTWHAVLERSFLTWADMFAFGMVAAVAVTLVREGRLPWLRASHAARATAAAALVTVAATGTMRLPEPVQALMLATVLGGVVLTVGLPSPPTRARRLLEWRPVVLVGVVSYSVYLWHMPVIGLLRRTDLSVDGRIGYPITAAIVFVLSVAAAAVTYRYVERPGLERKRRPTRDGAVPARPATATPPDRAVAARPGRPRVGT